ncbi:hypothetical protein FA13DRAFT_144584 [Coprinellus micaceus]|uniref:Uncharacterized protein n=1 Tax=Coprinellus micaceus TaxID=71717 RepID=A0A4Y7SJ53_COPMI|nr:hypothetical protein FA13DRAFT_144584 [Coprinellus micaceus]
MGAKHRTTPLCVRCSGAHITLSCPVQCSIVTRHYYISQPVDLFQQVHDPLPLSTPTLFTRRSSVSQRRTKARVTHHPETRVSEGGRTPDNATWPSNAGVPGGVPISEEVEEGLPCSLVSTHDYQENVRDRSRPFPSRPSHRHKHDDTTRCNATPAPVRVSNSTPPVRYSTPEPPPSGNPTLPKFLRLPVPSVGSPPSPFRVRAHVVWRTNGQSNARPLVFVVDTLPCSGSAPSHVRLPPRTRNGAANYKPQCLPEAYMWFWGVSEPRCGEVGTSPSSLSLSLSQSKSKSKSKSNPIPNAHAHRTAGYVARHGRQDAYILPGEEPVSQPPHSFSLVPMSTPTSASASASVPLPSFTPPPLSLLSLPFYSPFFHSPSTLPSFAPPPLSLLSLLFRSPFLPRIHLHP